MEDTYILTEDLEISVNGYNSEKDRKQQRPIVTEEIDSALSFEGGPSYYEEDFDPQKVLELIDIAADRALNGPKNDISRDEYRRTEEKKKYSSASKIIEDAADDMLTKQQSDYIKQDIENRFRKLRNMGEDNFNLLEAILQCNKLVQEYKKLAKINEWTEIETLLSMNND